MIRFTRSGGSAPPDREVLEIGRDGDYRLWRSVAVSTRPWTPVGLFTGRLSELDGLLREVEAAREAGHVRRLPPPDSAVDAIEVDGARLSVADSATVDGPWEPLLHRLRGMLVALTAAPTAALDLVLGDAQARLRHLGTQDLLLDLRVVTLLAEVRDGGATVDQRSTTLCFDDPEPVTAGPGWSRDLSLRDIGHDGSMGLRATFAAADGDVPVRVTTYAERTS